MWCHQQTHAGYEIALNMAKEKGVKIPAVD